MKSRIIGTIFLAIVLVILYVLTDGGTDNKQVKPPQTQPQTKFNF